MQVYKATTPDKIEKLPNTIHITITKYAAWAVFVLAILHNAGII